MSMSRKTTLMKVTPIPKSSATPLKLTPVNDKKMVLTFERAIFFLELEEFKGERPPNQAHLDRLYSAWVGKRFMWDHCTIAMAMLGSKMYRVNGNHTCWLRKNISDEVEDNDPTIKVREVTYEVKSEEELRQLYSIFDRGLPRTNNHITKVLLAGSCLTHKVEEDLAPAILSGFKFWLHENLKAGRLVALEDFIAFVSKEHGPLFREVAMFLADHYKITPWSKRNSAVGAMAATFNKDVKSSIKFWKPVCDGLDLMDQSDPRWQLRNIMSNAKMSVGGTGRKITAEDLYRVSIYSWNQWRAGLKCKAAPRPPGTRVKVN